MSLDDEVFDPNPTVETIFYYYWPSGGTPVLKIMDENEVVIERLDSAESPILYYLENLQEYRMLTHVTTGPGSGESRVYNFNGPSTSRSAEVTLSKLTLFPNPAEDRMYIQLLQPMMGSWELEGV